ncbi:MAG: nickel/cobalt efflux transporter, partial [Pseudomonadota bacterium]
WFMIVSGLIVVGMAAWMVWLAWPRRSASAHNNNHHHHHHHDHDHHHHDQHHHDHHHDHEHHHHDHLSADAHTRAHAAEIRERLASGQTGTWQTIVFGLTGGLIPCPAAITVFLLCLHLGKFALGVILVGAFSLGLAVVLVGIGVIAAVGMSALSARTSRLDGIIAAAPYISGVLIGLVGVLIIFNGYSHLTTA